MKLQELEEAYNFFKDRGMHMCWEDLIWWMKLSKKDRDKVIKNIPPNQKDIK